MSKKTLSSTNPFLNDPRTKETLVERSVKTSCGVEGIVVKNLNTTISIHRKPKRIYRNQPLD